MKTYLLAIAMVCGIAISNAQSLPDFNSFDLKTKADYTPTVTDAVSKAANYLLSTPIEKDNMPRLKCAAFLIKWMTGTPDYTFTIDEQAAKFAKKNDEFLIIYMAALTKAALDNKADAADAKKLKLASCKLIAEYAKNPDNKVKLNSELKKLIEAEENGTLATYLKL